MDVLVLDMLRILSICSDVVLQSDSILESFFHHSGLVSTRLRLSTV